MESTQPSSTNEVALNKLLLSITKQQPIATEEISLIDKFIFAFSGVY